MFQDNWYRVLVSNPKRGSAVFYGDVDLQPSNSLAQVWIQSYNHETFERIFGGSIQLTGNNVPITFIDNSKFINNFGDDGAAINFIEGGGLYIENSQFYFEYFDEPVRTILETPSSIQVIDLLPYIRKVFNGSLRDIYTTYDDRIGQKFLFDDAYFDEEILDLSNSNGQIKIV